MKKITCTFNKRSELVQAVRLAVNKGGKYLGAPTFAYDIGGFIVDKDGGISWEEKWELAEQAQELIKALTDGGFCPTYADEEEPMPEPSTEEPEALSEPEIAAEAEAAETPQEAPQAAGEEPDEETPAPKPETATQGATGLEISVPDDLTDKQYENLSKLIEAKTVLMCHAFKTNLIATAREHGKLTVTGFMASDGDHTAAYMVFVTKLVEMAKNAKHVSAKDRATDNEKFAFRCFLLRLGMIGDEYKGARKILLENLTGSSAFKDNRNLKKQEAVNEKEQSA